MIGLPQREGVGEGLQILLELVDDHDLTARLHGVGSFQTDVSDGLVGLDPRCVDQVTGQQHARSSQSCYHQVENCQKFGFLSKDFGFEGRFLGFQIKINPNFGYKVKIRQKFWL